jgi:dTMP kinase
LSLFITFEGVEGCGKTTQSRILFDALTKKNVPVELVCEPGGTGLGDGLRYLLKREQQVSISPEAELFLFSASRIQLIIEIIRPCLQQGQVVICDRFSDSTVAYQGYGRGLDLANIKAVNTIATSGIKPDITFLLDISSERGLNRKHDNVGDRFEEEDIVFHKRVREGYLTLVAEEPDRWCVIDGTLPREQVSKLIWDAVCEKLPRC